ncbi:MAG TPA: hypothetical protein VGN12_28525 [Pirellulales bacterium]|jgi:hypothetical protein
MDRQSSIEGRAAIVRSLAPFGELLPGLIAILLALQVGMALVLVTRRLQGAITPASSPGWPVAWMVLAALVAAATRGVWWNYDRLAKGPGHAIGWFVPVAALVLTALALTSLRMSIAADLVLWGIVAIEEVATTLWLDGPGYRRAMAFVGRHWPGNGPLAERLRSRIGIPDQPSAEIRPPSSGRSRLAADAGSSIDELLTASAQMAQRFERLQSADGRDVLAGMTTMQFTAGQVTAHVHLAFCPPFAHVPRIDYRQIAGPAARLKLGQVLPHGVRIDVKLAAPAAERTQLRLELRASQEPQQTAETAKHITELERGADAARS